MLLKRRIVNAATQENLTDAALAGISELSVTSTLDGMTVVMFTPRYDAACTKGHAIIADSSVSASEKVFTLLTEAGKKLSSLIRRECGSKGGSSIADQENLTGAALVGINELSVTLTLDSMTVVMLTPHSDVACNFVAKSGTNSSSRTSPSAPWVSPIVTTWLPMVRRKDLRSPPGVLL